MNIIILNDYEYAKQMLNMRSLGHKPYQTIVRVAKYLMDIEKCPKKLLKHKIELYIAQCNTSTPLPKWSELIDHAISHAQKYNVVDIESINITKAEMEKINSLQGRQLKRLAFTLLCLAKYWNIANNTDTGWVNSSESQIMRHANISTSLKRQSAMYAKLKELDMIDTSMRVDNTNVRVKYIDDDSEIVLRITDFRNLGFQYHMFIGEPYYICSNCGITSKVHNPGKGRYPKYCPICAQKLRVQRTINNVMSKEVRR